MDVECKKRTTLNNSNNKNLNESKTNCAIVSNKYFVYFCNFAFDSLLEMFGRWVKSCPISFRKIDHDLERFQSLLTLNK